MQWLRNIKMNGKLMIMILIPMLGVLYFSITVISDKISHLNNMDRLQQLTQLAVNTNDMIHELQKERGLVSGYFGKQLNQTESNMLEQRKVTDQKLVKLQGTLNTFSKNAYGETFENNLAIALASLQKLDEERRNVDSNAVSEVASLAYYRKLMEDFFHVMEVLNQLSPDAKVTTMLSAYNHFSKTKVAASRERAIVYNIFSKNRLDTNDKEQTQLEKTEQELYFSVFTSFSTPEALNIYNQTVKGQAVNEVSRLEKLVLEGQPGVPFNIDPEHWYQAATEKIDLMKEVEDLYSLEIHKTMNEIKRSASNSLIAVIAVNLFIIIVSICLIMMISRLIVRQIDLFKSSTELILVGNTDVEVNIASNDEIGDMAYAFNQMVASFRDVITQADRISQGDYELSITPRSDKDRLSIALTGMLTSLKETKAENERQYWLKTQLARLTGLSQGVVNVQQLVTMLISEIAGLVGAGQAVFYIQEVGKQSHQTGDYLLLGSYAYTERKHLSNRIRKGEGVIGQCALEKKPILLTNVPADYIQISSGLGESKPLNLLVLPIIYEDEVVGVMELASFERFTDIQNDLLGELSATLGVVINSVVGRQRTEELLRESQLLAEELQTQQEELRTANEELEEQTTMLKQSEEKLKIQSEELQAINEELEEKTNYLELQKADIEKQNKLIQLSKQEIEVKAEELELASKYKSEFLANMSHELRTPLNSLLILSKSLSENVEGNLSEDQIESAKVIYSGGLDLLTLINDILDLSKVEAGKLSIYAEEVKLESILRNLQVQFNPVARDKGLQFLQVIESGLPDTLTTDHQRTEQILKNLLSNAFKFTLSGSVTLRIHQPGADTRFLNSSLQASDRIAISVTDTGIGISEEKQRAIFEAFQQADGSTSRKYGGTGLGLTISRELAKLLGGEIQLVSSPGSGSTFTLYLPVHSDGYNQAANSEVAFTQSQAASEAFLGQTLAAAALQETEASPHPVRIFVEDDRADLQQNNKDKVILIIEDELQFAKLLMDLSRKKGFKCLVAGDGFSGLQLAKQYVPSAVLLDLGLPDMDGLKVLDHLKYHSETRHIPVHIISGREQSSASLKKGAIGFLSKPITSEDIDRVYNRIENVINERIKQILIIEDDVHNQKAIYELLKNKKIEIHSAYTGAEGLTKLKQQPYDCIILDLTLSDMSGFEMLHQMVDEHQQSLPPIIINTGKELTEEEYKELNRFTDSIVIKGVNSPERLMDEVSLFLHSVQKSLPLEQIQLIRRSHDSDETLKGRKILLVDDDLRNTFALSKVLRQHGLEVIMADNGLLALEKLDKEQDIELVIMDIMMPVMDGYEAMSKIRENPIHNKLPIIALTAKAMTGDREKCIERGANDYMTKPVDTDKLLSLIRVWLFR
jgi:CheY-like chemotaxis protein/methyl-accepting chemotaxis protein